jgi:four helix bundle protein
MSNIALEKSRKFAIRIYNLYKYLCEEKHEFTLAKQLLRSGTSIGANLTEAKYSVSRKEFLVKTKISLKECAETEYWLDLLKETNLITANEYNSVVSECKEILRLLISSVKTLSKNISQ